METRTGRGATWSEPLALLALRKSAGMARAVYYDSEEEDMKYNRHEHIRIDMSASGRGEGELRAERFATELNSDYSNLVYDPAATAAAAAELAALTGQSVSEVTAMLQAQQLAEIQSKGIEGVAEFQPHIFSYSDLSGATPLVLGAGGLAFSADEIPVVEHANIRTYDDSMLVFHRPLDHDPYLLQIYQPSHAANPAVNPPPDLLPPQFLPCRLVN